MLNDGLITLKEAVLLFPRRNGKPPHIVTVRRWILTGVKGKRLRAKQVGSMWYTTMAWVDEFMGPSTTPDVRAQLVDEQRRNEESKARLAARGIHVGSRAHVLAKYGL